MMKGNLNLVVDANRETRVYVSSLFDFNHRTSQAHEKETVKHNQVFPGQETFAKIGELEKREASLIHTVKSG